MAEKKEDETLINVGGVYSKTEQYVEENKNSLSIIAAAIILIVGGYFGYTKLYVGPLEEEAQSQMFIAERYFSIDSLNLALNGDGNYLGFIDIIDEYGITPSGNLANYYAGICFLQKGGYEQAIEYLSSFDSDDEMLGAVAKGAIGDCFIELGQTEEAITYYRKAAEENSNRFVSPVYLMKTAFAYEELGNYSKAAEIYQKIKNNYPDTKEGLEVDKYLARANAL